MSNLTTQSYEDVLGQIAEADERVVVMTAENRAAIRNLPQRLGGRFIDVGICEQTMLGAAAGLALRGRVPVVHALAAFLTMRAFEFIRTDVGIAHLPVKMVGGVPGVLSEANGPTHQAIEDVSLMRGIPGVQVVCPADAQELAAALPSIMASPNPCYIRHNNLPARVPHQPYELGHAERLTEGSDAAILTYGALVGEAFEAAALLRVRGINVRVVNLRSLVPLDTAEVDAAARDCAMLITVEDHFLTGGLFTILAEHFIKRGQCPRLTPIAFVERWFRPALLRDVLEFERMDATGLANRVASALSAVAPGRLVNPGVINAHA
ncbi:MAG: transketolase C-terminal domain-containing protein [Deltaproteobacteria bacterium]|nr:transketolase C-terminal domain-containing protein [Deltaproteobacteria bacterium]